MAIKFNKAKLKAQQAIAPFPKPHTILLVDDELANLRVLTRILEPHYHVLTAEDGQEALEMVQRDANPQRIHLIISDQRMRRLNGVEFLKQTIPIIPKTIRIILTGFTDIEAIIDSINEGNIYKFLTKPIDSKELLVTVQRALEVYELEKKNLELLEELKALNTSLEEKVQQRTHELEDSYQTIKAQQEQMLEELEQARETQKCLLPLQIPEIPHVQIARKFVPMIQIGGDIYNIFKLEDSQFGVMVTDVTGHGIPAALLSFMVSGIFSNSAVTGLSPAMVVRLTNGYLNGRLPANRFATIFYGIYNAQDRTLTYTTAGHPPGLVIRPKTTEVFLLQTDGIVVGSISDERIVFEEDTFQLEVGDKVLLYTDGLIELMDESKELLGVDQLVGFAKEQAALPIQDLIEAVYSMGESHAAGVGIGDDITLLGLEIK